MRFLDGRQMEQSPYLEEQADGDNDEFSDVGSPTVATRTLTLLAIRWSHHGAMVGGIGRQIIKASVIVR